MLIAIIIGGFILTGMIDLWLRKKFKIEKNHKFLDQYLNKKHFVFEALACVLFMTFISGNGYTGKDLYFLLFLFFACIFITRAAVEIIFMRAKRKHLISFAYTGVSMLCSVGILLLL
ncbi:DUF4181 domain-containing protein [Solibacillus sp. FSL H8-0538]|uniref:DUF4181 domain-containing protein n=1 Tax=Solibacillus sp. FSL H8-0538 TaxID=2921400 RepID=UPI0030F5DE62